MQSRPQAIERVSASERQVMAEEVPAMASRPIQQAVMPQTQEVPPREMREAVQSREQPAMVEQSTAVVSQEPASVVSTESIVAQAPIVESAVVHSEQPSTASMGEPSVERNDPVEVKSAAALTGPAIDPEHKVTSSKAETAKPVGGQDRGGDK